MQKSSLDRNPSMPIGQHLRAEEGRETKCTDAPGVYLMNEIANTTLV